MVTDHDSQVVGFFEQAKVIHATLTYSFWYQRVQLLHEAGSANHSFWSSKPSCCMQKGAVVHYNAKSMVHRSRLPPLWRMESNEEQYT